MHKIAIVTGASGGIGSAVAAALAQEYAVVVACNKNRVAVDQLAADLIAKGGEAAVFSGDLANSEKAAALAAFALECYGHIDLLVNATGIALFALAQDTTDAQYDAVLDGNFRAVFNTCRAVLPAMVARQSGAIINISSIWGQTGAACESLYSASKAAVIGYSKALAKEVGPSGITVNCVAPGIIDTAMNASLGSDAIQAFAADTPLGRIGTPTDVARAVLYIAQDRFTTGQIICPNGGAFI